MAEKELNAKQQRFVEEYLKDLNATQAAIRAGYSEKTAKDIGCENLAKPNIASEITKAKVKRSERTKIDADWVLVELEKQYDKSDEANETNVALNALDKIGKHVDVGAFVEKKEITGTISLSHLTDDQLQRLIDGEG